MIPGENEKFCCRPGVTGSVSSLTVVLWVRGLSFASSDVDKYSLSAALVCVVPSLRRARVCVCLCVCLHMQSSLTVRCDVLWSHSGTLLRLKMSFSETFILFVLAIFCIRANEEE